ncbi:MAG TPA: L,D-transpeptidase family protein [Chloroflexota bacterium]|nr:L,D-transpeptidase family protein [Chloroflexota bacterium]
MSRHARLLAGLVLALALAGPAAPVSADELVLDNADPSVQVTGGWTTTSSGDGFVGPNYLTLQGSSGSVFWPVPGSLASGHYQLFARWTGGSGHASTAVYTVSHGGGTVELRRDQRSNGGDWQLLGDFDFQAGQDQGVRLTGSGDGVLVADAIRWVTAPAPPPPTPTPPPPPPPPVTAPAAAPAPVPQAPAGPWTVTLQAAELHAGPDASTATLAVVPQFNYLQILGYQGEWAYVYNPRARGTAYVRSGLVGPSEPPPAWVTAPPPPSIASVEQVGRTVGAAAVAYYPVDDQFAYTARLGHNARVLVHERVQGFDGSPWYRVDQGYLPSSAVRMPQAPATTFAGRWIDADLREPAMLTAYEGNVPVLSTLAIKGTVANQTPTGVFTIGRRVADETMDSDTIGIPRFAPGGYHLEHVLFTQYFTSDGSSIHYNYWSSNWGYAGSHGCLGLPYADSQFLWSWADLGTRVVVHN